ncbi:hypothetical protein EDD18DRAFT_1108963 [Armillaria luteobubalina]|uniref:Uncharacterized protein n=1 Tax=Armillaria luteobubalina TaxID=153913 RepID=A0AA39PZM8_9AGAR|nr:hypothetical protein EDD18DRAFT_1108963 [Armillaria luteobubalina]
MPPLSEVFSCKWHSLIQKQVRGKQLAWIMNQGATNTPMPLSGDQAPSLSAGLTSQFHAEIQNPSSAPVTDDFVNSYNPKFVIEYHPRALLDPRILTLLVILKKHGRKQKFNYKEYREETWKYNVYFRPLWDWTLNLLSDATLSPFFVWDAVKIFQLDEKTNTKIWIFDEPWTGDLLWEIQSSLPPERGYPVIACIANLPDAICNGKAWGGGTVVGWLPISVAEYSHTGYAFKLPHSNEVIIIYPFILILSVDYEEQLQDLLEVYLPRTAEEMRDLYNLAEEEGEDVLDESSLRPVENVFWSIARSDPYKAISWDQLHAYHLDHLEIIPGVDKCAAKVVIDEFIANFPRWRNLTHFKHATDFDFGDTGKFEHMSKQILFAAQSVLTKAAHHDAYLLLKIENSKGFEKPTTWKIPKVHTQQHLFDDIIAKGVTKNYNTKPNECMHGPLKKAYQIQTNFKDVAEQILWIDHHYNIVVQIHEKIDCQKKHQQEETDDLSDDKNQRHQNQRIGALDSKAMLHSLKFTAKDPRTMGELEEAFHSDLAYERFHICLGRFMTAFLKRIDEDAVAEKEFIKYTPNDTTLAVTYQSLVNFKESADLLHCSPNFYNVPCYDGVIINTEKGVYIGQLIQLFECEYLEQQYPLALVHPFDVTVTDGGQHWKFQ